MLEVSPTHVKHIESGHRKPSIEILFEITKILNISLDGVVFSKNESARTDTRKKVDRLLDVSDEASLHFILSVLEALREKEQCALRRRLHPHRRVRRRPVHRQQQKDRQRQPQRAA